MPTKINLAPRRSSQLQRLGAFAAAHPALDVRRSPAVVGAFWGFVAGVAAALFWLSP